MLNPAGKLQSGGTTGGPDAPASVAGSKTNHSTIRIELDATA